MSNITNYIRRQPKDKLDILTFATHERYESNLALTGHEFFSIQEIKEWNHDYGSPPDNYHLLPKGGGYIGRSFDLILSQDRFGQFPLAQRINKQLGIPIITLEHTVPTPNLPENQIHNMRLMAGDVNIFISEYSANTWGSLGNMKNINFIEHCVDTEAFKPVIMYKERGILTCANKFVDRDYCLNFKGWERVTQGLPTKLIGDNPGISEAISDVDVLCEEYNSCGVYLNTTTFSTIPMSLLEAMSCGCAVVSTATCAIPEIIEHGVNGMISNDEKELRNYCRELITDPEKAAALGKQARETILTRFSKDRFLSEWNEIFKKTYEASL